MKFKGNSKSRFCQKKLNIPTCDCPTSSRVTSCYVPNQRKIMKLLLTILVLLFSSNVFSQSVNCEDAPSDAVVELPNPINQWSVIFCSPKGHVLAGVDGIVWVTKNNSSFMFRANRKVTSESTQHSSYFKKIAHRKLSEKHKLNTNKMLAEVTGNEDQNLQPWQLDMLSNKGLLYNIFFYEKKGKVEHILGCINQCKSSVLLKPKTLAELKEQLGKVHNKSLKKGRLTAAF